MKHMEYITCFTTGFAILVFELTSFRLLAPHFGVSNYVTGTIINTILLALSIGYMVGGYAADKFKSERLPYMVILGSTLYLFVIYAIHPHILRLLSHRSVILGSSLAIGSMFFLPMILLAFIPPYFIKSLAQQGYIGKTSGEIFSLSTIGSIIGGLATTFFFIPYMGSRLTFLFTVVLLLIISVVGLWHFTKFSPMLFLLFIPFSFISANFPDLLYFAESEYNIVMVSEEKNERYLRLNSGFGHQSKSLHPATKLSGDYYDLLLVAQLFTDSNSTLILGNGAGTSMMQLRHFFNAPVDGVEIDSVLTDVGKDYFGLVLDDRSHIFHEDARRYLINNKKKYHVILIDIFAGSPCLPFHVTTVEFYSLVREALHANGVVAINLPRYAGGTELGEYLLNTIVKVFPNAFLSFHVLYAFQKDTNLESLQATLKTHDIPPYLAPVASIAIKNMRKVMLSSPGEIFTDDHAPIESMSYHILRKLVLEEERP